MEEIFDQTKKFSLSKLDDKPVLDNKNEMRLFLSVRNEEIRLPYFLTYYRELGIDRFFIVDDKSSDSTRAYLLTQADCHVFDPSNSFKESRASVDWQTLLLNTYGMDHWTIVADADELLVYPHCEEIKLSEFCKFLDSEGSTSFFAFMLDLYPDGNLSNGDYEKGMAFYDACPYFDKDYDFRVKGTFSSAIEELPRIRVSGGPRVRKFYPYQKNTSFLNRLILGVVIKAAEKLCKGQGDKPHYAPALIKVPLVKWGAGCKRLSNHVVVNPTGHISTMRGAILHFKFFADFHEKAKSEIARGEHFNGSQEYIRYLKHIEKNPDLTFMYEGSRLYTGPASLAKENLIASNEAFDAYLKSKR
jgi:hypothetical protein